MASTTNSFHCCCYHSSPGGEALALVRRNFRLNLQTIHRSLFVENVGSSRRARFNLTRCSGASEEPPEEPKKPRRRKSVPESDTEAMEVKKKRPSRRKSAPVDGEVPEAKVKKRSTTRKKTAPQEAEDEKISKKTASETAEDNEISKKTAAEDENITKKKVKASRKKAQVTVPEVVVDEVPKKRTRLDIHETGLPDIKQIISGPSWVISVREEDSEEEILEEDEEEEEDDDEDYYEEEEKKDVMKVVDPEFPDKESYALISSYKKLEVPEALPKEKLWWNWQWQQRGPEEHIWSAFQKRESEPDITMAAMTALAGQIELFGDTPSVAETSLFRARKYLFKDERLAAEEDHKFEVGPLAYYSEWVKAWKKDTSREAVQKHFEETGEDEDTQLQIMLTFQTREEFRHMMGTDMRIQRDPLLMRITEEMQKTVHGGDPVYPTINYIRDPDEITDWRGPNFHEPRMTPVEYLKKCGTMKTREQHNEIMALEQLEAEEEAELVSDDEELGDEEIAGAVDIGEKETEDDEETLDEEDEVLGEDDALAVVKDEDEALKDQNIELVPREKLAEILTDEEEDIDTIDKD